MKKDISRRAALSLLGGGFLLSITGSGAYTSRSANRDLRFDVVSDQESKLNLDIEDPIIVSKGGGGNGNGNGNGGGNGNGNGNGGGNPNSGPTATKQLVSLSTDFDTDVPVTISLTSRTDPGVQLVSTSDIIQQNTTVSFDVEIKPKQSPSFIEFEATFTLDEDTTTTLYRTTNIIYD